MPAAPAPLAWTKCGAVECAELEVPLDYANPHNAELISLLVKRRATKGRRIGPLLVNPGGPGAAGSVMADRASLFFSPDLLNRFDIVAWDPRGTGASAAIDCVDDIDVVLGADPSPDSPEETTALATANRTFADGCRTRAARQLAFVSTEYSARDMDQIRRALGEDTISYFGFSYGSELGATYATLFPRRVRAMVVDGASDPNADWKDSTREQVVAFESALNQALAECVADKGCPFVHAGDAGAAFDQLMRDLDATPITVAKDRPAIGQGVAYYAVVSTLYGRSEWKSLYAALGKAQKGDATGLLALYDDYTFRNDADQRNLFDSLIVINCLDSAPVEPAAALAFARELAVLAPHLGSLDQSGEQLCAHLPKSGRPVMHVDARGAGPILVVGTTGDTATPFESSRKMAKALEQGHLLTVEAERHTGYGVNQCSLKTVDAYLIDLTIPGEGTVCR